MSYTYVTGYEGKVEKGLLIDAQAFADVIYDTCEKYLEERGETLNDVDNLPGNSLLIDDGSVLSKGKLSPDKYKFDISGEEYNFSWEKKPAEVLEVIKKLLDDFVASTYELGGKRRIIYASEAYNIMTEAAWNTLRIYGQSLTFLTEMPSPDNGGVDKKSENYTRPIMSDGAFNRYWQNTGCFADRETATYRPNLFWGIRTTFSKPSIIPSSITTSLIFYGLRSSPDITLNTYRSNNTSTNIVSGRIIDANEVLEFLDSLFIYNAEYTINTIEDKGIVEDYTVSISYGSTFTIGFPGGDNAEAYWLNYNMKKANNGEIDMTFDWMDLSDDDDQDGKGAGSTQGISSSISWDIKQPNTFSAKIFKASISKGNKFTNIVAESSSGIASKNYICKEDEVVRLIANSSNGKGVCWLRKKGSSNFEPILEGPSTAMLAIGWKCNAGDELMCTSEGNGMSRIYSEKI